MLADILENVTCLTDAMLRQFVFLASLDEDSTEQWCKDTDRGKQKYTNQSQCHFVHHKSHMDELVTNPGPAKTA
jgi:hypothetical protein